MALKDLEDFANDLNSLVNKHGATYDEFSALVGGDPLTDVTDAQINNYFGKLLSDTGIALVKGLLEAMENTIPMARISKEGIDGSTFADIGKLTE